MKKDFISRYSDYATEPTAWGSNPGGASTPSLLFTNPRPLLKPVQPPMQYGLRFFPADKMAVTWSWPLTSIQWWCKEKVESSADPGALLVYGVGLKPLHCWDRGTESRWGLRCSSFVFVLCWYDIWYDMTWYDICDVIWYDMIYVIWYDIICDMIWCYMIRLDKIWYMIYDMIWYMMRYNMIPYMI